MKILESFNSGILQIFRIENFFLEWERALNFELEPKLHLILSSQLRLYLLLKPIAIANRPELHNKSPGSLELYVKL